MNYMLISIATLSRRAKGVGVHKCNGASSTHIFRMFMAETGILVILSVLLSFLLIINARSLIEDLLSVFPHFSLGKRCGYRCSLSLFSSYWQVAYRDDYSPVSLSRKYSADIQMGRKGGSVRCCLCSLQEFLSSWDCCWSLCCSTVI